MLSPVSFADVVNRTSTVVHEDDDEEEEDLTRRASANEGWKSCDNSRNLWLDTLDDDCLSSDEDQNDSSNYSERNVRLKKDRFSSSSCTLHFFSSSLTLKKYKKRFALNEMIQEDASNFSIFYAQKRHLFGFFILPMNALVYVRTK